MTPVVTRIWKVEYLLRQMDNSRTARRRAERRQTPESASQNSFLIPTARCHLTEWSLYDFAKAGLYTAR